MHITLRVSYFIEQQVNLHNVPIYMQNLLFYLKLSGLGLHHGWYVSRHKLEELGGETSSHFQPSERTSGELLSDQTDGSPSHTGDLKQVIEARAREEIERSGVPCQTVVKVCKREPYLTMSNFLFELLILSRHFT